MSVFVDRKYEELDWISQATEPIDSELNLVLSQIPDEYVISFQTYVDMIGDSYDYDLSRYRAVNYLINIFNIKRDFSYDSMNLIYKSFELETTGQPIINFREQTISGGQLLLVKKISTIDEKDLKDLLGQEGIHAVRCVNRHDFSLSRSNEIMELLGSCDDGLRSRSAVSKRMILVRRLSELFKTNEWNIKDTELANKMGRWIAAYVKDGNLAAMSNFCRLKVMTHKGQPIYSMEEVQ